MDLRAGWLIVVTACGQPPRDEARAPAPRAVTADAAIADAATATIIDAGGPCPVAKASLGPGLVAERWPVAGTPAAGEPCIDVVRADLAHYKLRALTAEHGARTAPAWQSAFDLVAVINAGMFGDAGAPVGLVIADGTPHGADNPKLGGVLAFDPVSPTDPPLAITGRNCAHFDLDALRTRYRSLVQSYRLLGCDGGALPWQDPKQYSAAAIGVDRAGRVVFLHARGAFTMRELSAALAGHDLIGAIFLEGGPEASLVVHGADGGLERIGSYETNFFENDGNTVFWDLPNVLALSAR